MSTQGIKGAAASTGQLAQPETHRVRDFVSSVGHVSFSIEPRQSTIGTASPNADLSFFIMPALQA